ncbi:MAG: heavy metal-binding domain-containing protein, partial [Thermodesulfovibrionales bacterium]
MRVSDPVCKMTIEADKAAATSTYKGQKYYFCSQACKQKFDRAPESFTDKQSPTSVGQASAEYTCPMHPEVRQQGPGTCRKCGMALELASPAAGGRKTEWTCPMHPEVVRESAGSCPICGMALEPRSVSAEEEENPELSDMTRRFKVSAVLTIPVFLIAMRHHLPGLSLIDGVIASSILKWLELILATPVVLWGGWPFFVRGWRSIITWNPNMFTLIGLGTGVAYVYSLVAALLPGLFPPSFRTAEGDVGVYF